VSRVRGGDARTCGEHCPTKALSRRRAQGCTCPRRAWSTACWRDELALEPPVVHTAWRVGAKTALCLTAVFAGLDDTRFRYLNEWFGARPAILEFHTHPGGIDGIVIDDIDMISADASDRIVRLWAMISPSKAIDLLHEDLAAQIRRLAPGN
jgi:hypothetical protein